MLGKLLSGDGKGGIYPRRLRVALALIVVASVTVLIVDACVFYRWYFVDDAFISMRYSKRLLQGKGLTWTDGERVEGYTNFLWTVLVALFGLLPKVSMMDVARVINMVCMSVAVLLVLLSNRPRSLKEAFPSLAVGLTLAISAPIAAWAAGGLEQALLGALLVAAMVLFYPLLERDRLEWRELLPSAMALALAALTRPDAGLFTASSAAAFVVLRRFRFQAFVSAAKLCVIPFGTFAAHALVRKAYYDDWVPNTFHAKVALTSARVHGGWTYVLAEPSPAALLPLLALAVVAASMDAARRRRVFFVVIPLVVWLAHVVVIGGDVEPEQRHMVPAFLLLALLHMEGLAFFAERWKTAGPVIAHAMAVGTLVFAAVKWKTDPHRDIFSRTDSNERKGMWVGRFLKRAFEHTDALLAVDAAGATPYYAELDTLDMLGLNDRFLAHNRPSNFGTAALGHELGNGAYLLRRKPDLVLFGCAPGQYDPVWVGGKDMVNTQEFRDHYVKVRFWVPSPVWYHGLLWARHEDSRVGIQRSDSRITVPGYFFSAGPDVGASFDPRGKLATVIPTQKSASFDFDLPAGSWKLDFDTDGPVTASSLLPVPLDSDGVVTLPYPAKVRVEVTAGSDIVYLRSVNLSRPTTS